MPPIPQANATYSSVHKITFLSLEDYNLTSQRMYCLFGKKATYLRCQYFSQPLRHRHTSTLSSANKNGVLHSQEHTIETFCSKKIIIRLFYLTQIGHQRYVDNTRIFNRCFAALMAQWTYIVTEKLRNRCQKYVFNARNSIMTDLGLSLLLWTKEEFDLAYLEK